jgi:hypothetical protein
MRTARGPSLATEYWRRGSVHRINFRDAHAIRKRGNPGIDHPSGDAQNPDLDRLAATVSPVLWKKNRGFRPAAIGAAARGRQERERMAFRAAAYWNIAGVSTPGGAGNPARPTGRLIAWTAVAPAGTGSGGVLLAATLAGRTAQALAAGLRDRPFTARRVHPYRSARRSDHHAAGGLRKPGWRRPDDVGACAAN